jgi:archaellum component FlaC
MADAALAEARTADGAKPEWERRMDRFAEEHERWSREQERWHEAFNKKLDHWEREGERISRDIERMAEEHKAVSRDIERMTEEHKVVSRDIKRMTEEHKVVSKDIERMSQNIGGLNRSLGELIETLIAARLWEKFSAWPYGFEQAYRRIPVFDKDKSRVVTEIDILLDNTDYVMAVEVKREADDLRDVDYHINRMDLIRQFPSPLTRDKILLGAVAGGVVTPVVKNYAYQSGFFVLELTGESVALVPPPEGFTPRQW